MTDISSKHVRFTLPENRFSPGSKVHIKDSVLLIIVFIIGLIGSFYILHLTLRKNTQTLDSSIFDSQDWDNSEALTYSGLEH